MGWAFVKIADALSGVNRISFDTAPVIYYIENHPIYVNKMDDIIKYIENNNIDIICASLILTETLIKPMKTNDQVVMQAYQGFFNTPPIQLLSITPHIAQIAAQLRANYNLKTPDALYVAVAINAKCNIFLTNDNGIKRVQELTVLTLDDLDL